MTLYQHQKDLIEENPAKRTLAMGCGTGKTRTALFLAKDKGSILVVAPKTQVLDQTWERERKTIGFEDGMFNVISKEKFRKGGIDKHDVLILDEAHCFLGVTPATRYKNKIEVPRTSQLFEETLKWVKTHKPKALYLCSATPLPTPMALWAVAQLFGDDFDYFAFRRRFYQYVPNIGRGVWLPRKDKHLEQELVAIAKKYMTFGRLEDFFDVPPATHKHITVGLSTDQKKAMKEVPLLYPDPLVRVGKRHQIEQGIFEGKTIEDNKISEIIDLAKEFKKLLVFAKYTAHIDYIAKKLKDEFKNKKILILDGRTIDRRELMRQAEQVGVEVIVIAQSQVSTGYELPSFRCTVFASMSYSFVDYQQALGRTQRANNISKNVYVYLVAGDIDRAVLDCVSHKRDFNELLYAKE